MSHPSTPPRCHVAAITLASVLAIASGQPTLTIPPGTQPAGGDGDTTVTPTTANAQPLTVEVQPVPEPVREHDRDALDVLEAAERAIGELRAFSVTLTIIPRGTFKGTNPEGSVDIIARRWPEDPDRWQLRITGPITPDRSPDPINIDAVVAGDRMKHIDHDDRRIGARVLPVRLNQKYFDVPYNILSQELWTRPDAFAEFYSAERLTLESRQTVDGVECDVVRAVQPGGIQTMVACIGVEDHLPRRLSERYEMVLTPGSPPFTGDHIYEYTSLTVDPDLDDDDFVIPLPEGYVEERFPTPNPVGNGVPARIDPKPPSEGGSDGATPDGDSAAAAAAGEDGVVQLDPEQLAALSMSASASGVTVPMPGVPPTPPSAGPAESQAAPAFELKNAAGQTVRLADLGGQRVVLVFWGSWNPWARDLVNALKPVMDESSGTRWFVLAVRERSDQTSVQRFEQLGTAATLLPAADQVAAEYAVGAIPTVVVIDGDGRIALRHVGFNAEQSPVDGVREALGLAAPESEP